MAGICDRYSSICHEKRFIIFFFSSKTDFLKGSFFFFSVRFTGKVLNCGNQKRQLSVIVKELFDGRIKEVGNVSSLAI